MKTIANLTVPLLLLFSVIINLGCSDRRTYYVTKPEVVCDTTTCTDTLFYADTLTVVQWDTVFVSTEPDTIFITQDPDTIFVTLDPDTVYVDIGSKQDLINQLFECYYSNMSNPVRFRECILDVLNQ